MIEVINRQDQVELDVGKIADFAERAVDAVAEAEGRNPVIAFVDNVEMKELNFRFRGKKTTTDVLSFEYDNDEFDDDESLGDIVISAEKAASQAAEHEMPFDLEIRQLVLHGILHLCGFDHETDDGEMNMREIELREVLNIS